MQHFRSPSNPWRKTTLGAFALAVVCLLPAYQLAQASPPQGGPGGGANSQGSVGQTPGTEPSYWLAAYDRSHADNLSCDFQNYDVRQALTKVFQRHGKNFRIDPEVKGTVAISIRNVTLASGVENIARQVGAGYTIERGVYVITNRPSITPTRAIASHPADVIHREDPISLSCAKADVREVLRQLFRLSPRSYAIDPMIQGTVTISVKEVAFEDALRRVLRHVGGGFQVKDGVYVIAPAAKPPLG